MTFKYVGPGFGIGVRWFNHVRPSRYIHFEVVFLFWTFYIKLPQFPPWFILGSILLFWPLSLSIVVLIMLQLMVRDGMAKIGK